MFDFGTDAIPSVLDQREACWQCGEPPSDARDETGDYASALCDRCRLEEAPELPIPREWSSAPRLRVVTAAQTAIEATSFLIPGTVPLGAVTLLVGDPGLGKSTLTAAWAAGVSNGTYGTTGYVLMANAEDSPAHVTVPRLLAAGADLGRVAFFTMGDNDGERPFTIPDDVPDLERHAARVGARLIVVDPLNAHLSDGTNAHRDHSMRRALAPLAAMAQRLNAAVVVIAHMNKATGAEAIYRISGSIGLPGAARSVLLFASDPDDPEGDSGSRRAVAHVKSNWGTLAPTLIYEHCPVNVTRNGVTVETHALTLIGESEASGPELLTPDREDSPASKRERAGELLADVLGDGEWHRAKDVQAVAGRSDIGRRTLERMCAQVGVESKREGFPAVAYWRLPSSCDTSSCDKRPEATVTQLEIADDTGDYEQSDTQLRHVSGVDATGLCEACEWPLESTPNGVVCVPCTARAERSAQDAPSNGNGH